MTSRVALNRTQKTLEKISKSDYIKKLISTYQKHESEKACHRRDLQYV